MNKIQCSFYPYKYEFGYANTANLNVNARPTISIIDPEIGAPTTGSIPGKFFSYGSGVARITKPYDVHHRSLNYVELGVQK